MPHLSVIIPTHKRANILRLCLEHLETQSIADDIEAIIIHDGEDKETDEMMKSSNWKIPVRYEAVAKCQQGIIRNRAVQKANADVCLLIGDDIFLKPETAERHVAIHNQHENVAVLGQTLWDPACGITPVMEWLAVSGWQFGYPIIEQYAGDTLPENIQHLFCYTSNLSLRTETLKQIPFREDVTMYGWEDIEWGMRLRDAGLKLFYESYAEALHHHRITLEDSLRRMEILGQSAVHMQSIEKSFDRVPQGWKMLAYKIFSMFPTMAGKHRKAFLRGIQKGSQ